jgi:ribosomal protein S18 acetylase RimI-like enzyme
MIASLPGDGRSFLSGMEAKPPASARRATQDDAPRLARLFAAAFARDPVFHWLARGGRGRAQALQRFFLWVMRERAIPQGETWITSDGYAGVTWIPPFNVARPSNLKDELRLLSVILSLTGLARIGRGPAMAKALEHAHPPEPYFYLAFIGVAPRFQGTGLGRGLLEETLARVDAAGTPAFLENSNPRNIALYERLGFRVTKEIIVRKDAPPLYAMLRPGRNG